MLNGKELQVGKGYLMRNGGTTKIIGFDVDTTIYPFYDNDGQSYTQNGNFYYSGEISDFDLIKEIDSEEYNPEQNLKEICNKLKETCQALQKHGPSGMFKIGYELQDFNAVTKPKHYQLIPEKNIEVKHIVAVLANRLGTNGYNGAFIGDYVQLMQYLMRFDEKNGKEDLEKAQFFLKSLLDGYPDVQKLKGNK